MSNVIDFLERLGKDAHLRHASDAQLEQALIGAQIDPAIRNAILLRDQSRLEALLQASPNVCCMIFSPAREDEHEDDDEDKQSPDEDGGDEPEKALRVSTG